MTSEPKPDKPEGDAELFIHLDVHGLAALLKAIEAAMVEGSGHLTLRIGTGITASSGEANRFARATVTYIDTPDDWRTRRPNPKPLPRTPVLELQS
ncbi:MAG TPA: hypothetical protein VK403_10220 [Allosphingosinicella sp.]|nr:hypothetical protein [Allosphingosinicella sp.]